MKPVLPSKTHSQNLQGNRLASGIPAVTSAYTDDGTPIHSIITCWQLSFLEWIQLLFTRKVYVEQLTRTLPPQKLSISKKKVNLDAIEKVSTDEWEGAKWATEKFN